MFGVLLLLLDLLLSVSLQCLGSAFAKSQQLLEDLTAKAYATCINLSSMQVYYCQSAVPGSSIGFCDFCGIVEPCSTFSACIPLIVCSAFEDIGFVSQMLPRLVQHDEKSWDSIERAYPGDKVDTTRMHWFVIAP